MYLFLYVLYCLVSILLFFFCKQKTAYEMRISDWSSDVCSSDLILATGSSALLAYQAALNTTSHNIANANTAGYSRQRVDLVSKLGDGSGSGYIGKDRKSVV